MAIAIFEPFCGKLYAVTQQLVTAQWGHFFVFLILKILGVRSFEVNFLKSVGKKSKKILY